MSSVKIGAPLLLDGVEVRGGVGPLSVDADRHERTWIQNKGGEGIVTRRARELVIASQVHSGIAVVVQVNDLLSGQDLKPCHVGVVSWVKWNSRQEMQRVQSSYSASSQSETRFVVFRYSFGC